MQRAGGDDAVLADLHEAVNEMAHVLRLYEAVLAERGIGRPYMRDDPG